MPTPHNIAQTDTLSLITEASWIGKMILVLLFGSSVTCWAIILMKWQQFHRIVRTNQRFMAIFQTGKSIDEVVTRSERIEKSPLSSVFTSGIKELRLIAGNEVSLSDLDRNENIQRALVRASSQEISQVEKYLGWLATTASAAPFVGLFGTVWGIMNAFQNIGASGAANLAVVAPGISEALITTAMGIGAAIPAVISYNYFTGQIRKLSLEIECFSQDLMNIIQRNFLSVSKKGK
jgi:biopolymer transport protein TolQ